MPNESIPAQFCLKISALSYWIQMRAEAKGTFAKPLYGQKLYRGFESPPLRHLVLRCRIPLGKAPQWAAISRYFVAQTNQRKDNSKLKQHGAALRCFSLEPNTVVRFAHAKMAKPLRSQFEQNAKGNLTSAAG